MVPRLNSIEENLPNSPPEGATSYKSYSSQASYYLEASGHSEWLGEINLATDCFELQQFEKIFLDLCFNLLKLIVNDVTCLNSLVSTANVALETVLTRAE